MSFGRVPLPVDICLLSRDPFTDIGGTVPELGLVVFGQRKELYSLVVDKRHFLEIDSHWAGFRAQNAPERGHVFPSELSTYAQYDQIVSIHDSVDSADHNSVREIASLTPVGTS